METKAPRGTYDILPPDSAAWHYLEGVLRNTAELYGFQEIRTPMFEHTELFERGVGTSTDVVSKEMYTFFDRSKRSLTLRPENTASCARAFIEHRVYSGLLPVKWYYMGPMFRYDRPQTGRFRQFSQFGVEVFGSRSPGLDAEVIILLVHILANLGLDEYELHLNSVGCSECRTSYREKLISHIAPVKESLCEDCQQRYSVNPLRVLDCKNKNCHKAIEGYPTLADNLCDNCREHYESVQEILADHGIDFLHDDNLVRGLDYYTNTAFEIHIPGIGAQSAVGGGGRYDGLVKECGGPPTPGVGFAMGLERVLLALSQLEAQKDLKSGPEVFVITAGGEYDALAFKVVQELRFAGIIADKDHNTRGLKAQMKYADRLGATLAVIIGDDEVKNYQLTLRNMSTGDQESVGVDEAIPRIKEMLV
ncbi:MAG: histidine--tRNA ligase [Deltaproteobacteria bacterium]